MQYAGCTKRRDTSSPLLSHPHFACHCSAAHQSAQPVSYRWHQALEAASVKPALPQPSWPELVAAYVLLGPVTAIAQGHAHTAYPVVLTPQHLDLCCNKMLAATAPLLGSKHNHNSQHSRPSLYLPCSTEHILLCHTAASQPVDPKPSIAIHNLSALYTLSAGAGLPACRLYLQLGPRPL